ncbi:FKBP12, partial [Symbiodinium sp. KB8]
ASGDPAGTMLTVLGVGVVLLGFGFVFWVFSLSPATDASGKAKASSLQGLANIEDTIEKIENMTPEEADEYQLRRGGFKKEQPKEEDEAPQDFVYRPVEGANTIYTVLKEGTGYGYVEPGDEVTVHATGLVRDTKTKFWSTKDPGQEPFTYTAGGGVIKGWDYGARGMRRGEIRGLRIPAGEGYGPRGFPSWGIPPDADLLFEIEVLDIKRNGLPI